MTTENKYYCSECNGFFDDTKIEKVERISYIGLDKVEVKYKHEHRICPICGLPIWDEELGTQNDYIKFKQYNEKVGSVNAIQLVELRERMVCMERFEEYEDEDEDDIKEGIKESLIEMYLTMKGIIKPTTKTWQEILAETSDDDLDEIEDSDEIKQAKAEMRIKFDNDDEFASWRNIVEHIDDDIDYILHTAYAEKAVLQYTLSHNGCLAIASSPFELYNENYVAVFVNNECSLFTLIQVKDETDIFNLRLVPLKNMDVINEISGKLGVRSIEELTDNKKDTLDTIAISFQSKKH